MNADLINVSEDVVKSCVLSVTAELNGVELSVPVNTVHFRHSSDEHLLLKDNNSVGGVALEKINLRSLLPKVMDVTPFQVVDKGSFQLDHDQPLEELQLAVNEFNDLRDIPLLGINEDVLKKVTDVPVELARNFVLFCKVHGFWLLDIGDVVLAQNENTLFITVVGTHPIYKGTVEVTV